MIPSRRLFLLSAGATALAARFGAGRISSILAADYTPIVGITLVIALMYVLVNTAVDLAYAAVDPRVRYG